MFAFYCAISYGDIHPVQTFDMAVITLVMISSVVFFGYIIASIAASLANADAQRAAYQEKINAIKLYMKVTAVGVFLAFSFFCKCFV